MQQLRRARLEAVIQEELSTVVAREIKDPRIPPITFTAVEVTPDAEQATVFISIFGGAQGGYDGAPPLSDENAKLRMEDCLKGLSSASGFLRKHLARILKIRHIPQLIFREDKGIENSIRVHTLLKQISGENVLTETLGDNLETKPEAKSDDKE